jgi:vacuolar-type H+-ATPase subunit E/Vma4
MMMKKLKTFIQNAMWIKLKAIKAEAEAELEAKREQAEKKR